MVCNHQNKTRECYPWANIYISYISHLQNTKVDALAELAATLALMANAGYLIIVATRQLVCPKDSLQVSEVHTTSANSES